MKWLWGLISRFLSRFAVEPLPASKPLSSPKPKPYTEAYIKAEIRPEKKEELRVAAYRIREGMARYEDVAAKLGNGIHWWFIGIVHYMEAGHFYPNHFRYHLHCGDPLTGRTVHIPKGRPKANPRGGTVPPSPANPYSWEESAIDALRYMGYDVVKDWSIENCLYLFEKYNGFGYKRRGVPSPYLWSYTDKYTSGKYVADGKFDPKAVSKQPGVAALMKALNILA